MIVVGLMQPPNAVFDEAANPLSAQLCAACVRRNDHRYKKTLQVGMLQELCVTVGIMRYNRYSLAFEFFPPAVSAARSASKSTQTHTRCRQPHTYAHTV